MRFLAAADIFRAPRFRGAFVRFAVRALLGQGLGGVRGGRILASHCPIRSSSSRSPVFLHPLANRLALGGRHTAAASVALSDGHRRPCTCDFRPQIGKHLMNSFNFTLKLPKPCLRPNRHLSCQLTTVPEGRGQLLQLTLGHLSLLHEQHSADEVISKRTHRLTMRLGP